jgi:hypothetical protein
VYSPDVIADSFSGAPAHQAGAGHGDSGRDSRSDAVDATLADGDVLKKIGNEDVHTYAEREVTLYRTTFRPQCLTVRTYSYALLNGQAGTDLTITVEDAQDRKSVLTFPSGLIAEIPRTDLDHRNEPAQRIGRPAQEEIVVDDEQGNADFHR